MKGRRTVTDAKLLLSENEYLQVLNLGWRKAGVRREVLESLLDSEEVRLQSAVMQVDGLVYAIHSNHFTVADLARLLAGLRKTLTEGIGV